MKSTWDNNTKRADAVGWRNDEYIWLTLYTKGTINNLEKIIASITALLSSHGIADNQSYVYASKSEIEYKGTKDQNENLIKMHNAKLRINLPDIFNKKYQYFDDVNNLRRIRVSHSSNLRLQSAIKPRDGSFTIEYGRASGIDSHERRLLNTSEGRLGYIDSDCYLQVGIRTSGFYFGKGELALSLSTSIQVIDEFIDLLLNTSDVYHAVVHCGLASQYDYGSAFLIDNASPSGMGHIQCTDNYRWCSLFAHERWRAVYGLYWGTLLSGEHVEILGGLDNIKAALENDAECEYDSSTLIREHVNGVFVRLSPAVLHDSVYFKFFKMGNAGFAYRNLLRSVNMI